MKKTVLSFLVICIAITTMQAQNEPVNPFEKYGYTPKIATLSKGKYVEFYDQDTIVQIGGAVFNTVTMKIMGFVEYDTVRNEYNISPEVISRWLSPDPLTSEFPSWSPYNYVLGNPIRLIDIDGLRPDDFFFNQQGDLEVRLKNNEPHRFFVQTGTILFAGLPKFSEINLNSQLGVLSRAVFAEAEGENAASKLAVAEVIRNRSLIPSEPGFGSTITEVVNAKRPGSSLPQFDFKIPTNKRFDEFESTLSSIGTDEIKLGGFTQSVSAAIKAIGGRSNTIQGATFFNSEFKTNRLSFVPVPEGANFNSFRKLNDKSFDLGLTPSLIESLK